MDDKKPSQLFQDVDREFVARELASFLPDRIFDAHAHIWPGNLGVDGMPSLPDTVDIPEYRRRISDLLPGRSIRSMQIPYPTVREAIPAANQWIADQVRQWPENRGLFMIHPEDDPEFVRQETRRMGLVGFKCYHVFAPSQSQGRPRPTWQADIPDYLPESLVRVAHEEGWVIVLHMVKSRAVADPGNLHWIRRYCQQYPNMKLILAHDARAFQPCHALEALESLRGLGNLFFDASANCEPIAHQAVLRYFGADRLMYGSDFPISHTRGRSVSVGDSFIWLYEDSPIWNAAYQNVQPVLSGLESLRSLKQACWSERLSDADVEKVFHDTAAKLLA